jgi:hypothetical protein
VIVLASFPGITAAGVPSIELVEHETSSFINVSILDE